MTKRGAIVLIDTNAIIEAHRVACWQEVTGFFAVETVEKCVEECASGKQHRKHYTPVDTTALRERIRVHDVNEAMRMSLLLEEPHAVDIDAGEQDLLSYALATNEIAYIICSPDVACMKVAARLGMIDRLVSLEKLLSSSGGGSRDFRENYTERWHRKKRNTIAIDLL